MTTPFTLWATLWFLGIALAMVAKVVYVLHVQKRLRASLKSFALAESLCSLVIHDLPMVSLMSLSGVKGSLVFLVACIICRALIICYELSYAGKGKFSQFKVSVGLEVVVMLLLYTILFFFVV